MHTHSTEVCPQSSPARTPSGAPVAAWPPTRERLISRARGVPRARPGARPPGPCFGQTTTTPNHCMRKSEPAPDGASQHAVRKGRNALRSKTGGRTARSVRRLLAMRAQRPVGTAVATGFNPCAFLFSHGYTATCPCKRCTASSRRAMDFGDSCRGRKETLATEGEATVSAALSVHKAQAPSSKCQPFAFFRRSQRTCIAPMSFSREAGLVLRIVRFRRATQWRLVSL